MELLNGIRAVFLKDLQSELRSRYAINTVCAFVGSALLLILFSLDANQLAPTPQSGLLWIIILFAALSSLSRSFVTETERHTFDLLRLHGTAASVYCGKLAYNFLFSLSINLLTFLLYIFLLGLPVANIPAALGVLLLGTAGLSAVATMLAAIVSQADRQGAIFSVLCIPLLFPLILILVDATRAALLEGTTASFWSNFLALTGFAGVTITTGLLLFDFIWND